MSCNYSQIICFIIDTVLALDSLPQLEDIIETIGSLAPFRGKGLTIVDTLGLSRSRHLLVWIGNLALTV